MSPVTVRLRELREAKGWSQQRLAEAARVRIATVSAIENHRTRGIDFDVLDRIAAALEIDPGFLFVRAVAIKPRARGRPKVG